MNIDKKSLDLLRYIAANPGISRSEIDEYTSSNSVVNPYIDKLCQNEFISADETDSKGEWLFHIKPGGYAYIEAFHKSDTRYWITTAISIIAIITGIISILLQLLR